MKQNQKAQIAKEKCQKQLKDQSQPNLNEKYQSNKNKLNDNQNIQQNINIDNIKNHQQLLSSGDQHQLFKQAESCINKKEAVDFCITSDCRQIPYTCGDRKCTCRQFHLKCQKQDLQYFQKQTSKKIEEQKQKIKFQIMNLNFVDVDALISQLLNKMIQKQELKSLSSSQIKLYKHSKNKQNNAKYAGKLSILFDQVQIKPGESQRLNVIPKNQANQVQMYELDQWIHLFPWKKILKISSFLLLLYFLSTQLQWHKQYPILKMGKIIQNQQKLNQTNNRIQEISQNSQAELVKLNQTNENAIKYIKQECQANQTKIMQENQENTKKIVNQKKQELEKLKQQNEQEIKNERSKNSKIQEELQKNLSQCQITLENSQKNQKQNLQKLKKSPIKLESTQKSEKQNLQQLKKCQITLENSQKSQKQKSQQLERARKENFSLSQRLRKQQSKWCQIF